MLFKEPEYEAQFNELPPKLQAIVMYFDELSHQYGVEAVVTRCWDAVPGDSGVHEAHRGVDCRDQYDTPEGVKNLYNVDQVNSIVSDINQKYPRTDGFLTCKYHSFEGGKYHFHLQISYADSISPVSGVVA